MSFFITYINKSPVTGVINTTSLQDIEQCILNGAPGQLYNHLKYIPKYITNCSNDYGIIYRFITNHCISINEFISMLHNINNTISLFISTNNFSEDTKNNFYTKFQIDKRNGRGKRNLIEPREDLKQLQKLIKNFLEKNLSILPHDAAHGFRENRDAVTNATTHQFSKHVVNTDLKNFFPSITAEMLRNQLNKLSPFALINNNNQTYFIQAEKSNRLIHELIKFRENIIDIATLDGCLPQGSPLSPLLTNLVMIEFDYMMYDYIQKNNDLSASHVMYTRYVDDMTFSSVYSLKLNNILRVIQNISTLCYNNQLIIHPDKIKYLTNTGKCYITGVKLNQDNNITYGHEKKTILKHEIFQLFMDKLNGTLSPEHVGEVLGQFSWLMRIERNYALYLQKKYLLKFQSPYRTLGKHFLN